MCPPLPAALERQHNIGHAIGHRTQPLHWKPGGVMVDIGQGVIAGGAPGRANAGSMPAPSCRESDLSRRNIEPYVGMFSQDETCRCEPGSLIQLPPPCTE